MDFQQQQQHADLAEKKSAVLQSSSRNELLASFRENQGNGAPRDETQSGKYKNSAPEAVIVPASLSFETLAASGTLRWKHVLFSPVKAFHRIKRAKEEASLRTPSVISIREGVNLPLVGEVKWSALKKAVKVWLHSPEKLALLLWGTAVGVSGAILFLVMTGMLDHVLRNKKLRDTWFEANNQILNALFTMMCLYLHPQRLLHAFLLYRWQPDDIKKLRNVYCKDGTYKPHEWSNMLVVVLLLNLNCFAQYALCGLNWGYKRSQRPALGIGICLAVAIGAPAAAGIYTITSSLGKDYEEDEEHLAERQEIERLQEKRLNQKQSWKIGRGWNLSRKMPFVTRDGKPVDKPEWRGGLFDWQSDLQVTFLTAFCGFCVFGFNMERLGFGNRFVHIVTFMLLCSAPYWVFLLAATNINNSYVRHGLTYGGIVLCCFGLLYGGFWRIQMRTTFGLPPQRWCFGKAELTDCTQWLFCSLCSLCQEVRTSEYYKVQDNKFYMRYRIQSPAFENSIVPSPPQGNISLNIPMPSPDFDCIDQIPEVCLEIKVDKHEMDPPLPPVFQR